MQKIQIYDPRLAAGNLWRIQRARLDALILIVQHTTEWVSVFQAPYDKSEREALFRKGSWVLTRDVGIQMEPRHNLPFILSNGQYVGTTSRHMIKIGGEYMSVARRYTCIASARTCSQGCTIFLDTSGREYWQYGIRMGANLEYPKRNDNLIIETSSTMARFISQYDQPHVRFIPQSIGSSHAETYTNMLTEYAAKMI